MSADELYNLACGYSLCSAGHKVEKGAVERYKVRAMELLRKAVAAGYKDAPHMRKDTDLDPIRDRDDFKRLLADLEKNPSPEIAPPPPGEVTESRQPQAKRSSCQHRYCLPPLSTKHSSLACDIVSCTPNRIGDNDCLDLYQSWSVAVRIRTFCASGGNSGNPSPGS